MKTVEEMFVIKKLYSQYLLERKGASIGNKKVYEEQMEKFFLKFAFYTDVKIDWNSFFEFEILFYKYLYLYMDKEDMPYLDYILPKNYEIKDVLNLFSEIEEEFVVYPLNFGQVMKSAISFLKKYSGESVLVSSVTVREMFASFTIERKMKELILKRDKPLTYRLYSGNMKVRNSERIEDLINNALEDGILYEHLYNSYN